MFLQPIQTAKSSGPTLVLRLISLRRVHRWRVEETGECLFLIDVELPDPSVHGPWNSVQKDVFHAYRRVSMARQPLQVIVIPFRKSENVGYQFAVFHRADDSMWQFIAGGAEDDETAEQTARREAEEEAGIPRGARFFRLDSRASIPKTAFSPTDHWSKKLLS